MTNEIRKRNYRIFGIIAITIILIGYAFLGTSEPNTNDDLKIGVIIPLSGPAASLGDNYLKGLKLALGDNIELIVEDSESNPRVAISAARKLLDIDDVDMILSVQASISKPLASVVDSEVPIFASIVANEAFTKDYENTFNIYPLPEDEVRVAVDFMNNQGFENVAIITVLDEYGKSINDEFVKQFDGTIVANEVFLGSDGDYLTQLAKIKKTNPDAIYFTGYPGHVVKFVENMEKLGIETPVISGLQLQGEYVKNVVGYLLKDNMYSITSRSTLVNNKTKKFVTSYNTTYGILPDWAAPFGYDVGLVLNEVVKNEEDLLISLKGVGVEGLNGFIEFDEFGHSNVEMIVVRATDKKIIY